ncbi:MAG: ABC transporter permease, partial [Elusimicrobia bacterium]|nr:ABC transporter permease [Elusimicrobiota bacterium]
MNLGESVRTGFVEIWGHKTRSFLSFSSIAFGVAAILYTFAHVNYMYERREKTFKLAGPGRMEIEQQRVPDSRTSALSKGLTTEDAAAIREAMPWLYMVSPVFSGWNQVQDGTFKDYADVKGITPEWRKRGWVYKQRGRFFDDYDLSTNARVCIVIEPGGWVKKPFWARWWHDDPFQSHVKHVDMLGRTIRIGKALFTVVGVLKEPPRDKDPRWFDRNWNSTILVPLSTAQQLLDDDSRPSDGTRTPDLVEQIVVDTGQASTVARARRRIEALLNGRHRGVSDYTVRDFRQMIQNQMEEMRKTAVAVLAVGLVAILAGGVGIMNVTLATIFSRIREIGVRRALGATRADILVQFLTEAALLGVLGGVAGTGLGLAGIRYLADDGAETLAALLWWHLPATLAISVGAAVIFALYPAYQASRLDPVEALR